MHPCSCQGDLTHPSHAYNQPRPTNPGSCAHSALEQRGTVSCTRCGLVVVDSVVDQGQEWRQFDDDDGPSKSRVGGAIDPLLPVHEQLGTRVAASVRTGDAERDGRAAFFAASCAAADRTSHLEKGLSSLRSLCTELQLPLSVQQLACEIYHAVATAQVKMPRRNNVHTLFVACVYVAARGVGVPRSVAELARPVNYTGSSAFQSGDGLTDKQFTAGLRRIKDVAKLSSSRWLQELLQPPKGLGHCFDQWHPRAQPSRTTTMSL